MEDPAAAVVTAGPALEAAAAATTEGPASGEPGLVRVMIGVVAAVALLRAAVVLLCVAVVVVFAVRMPLLVVLVPLLLRNAAPRRRAAAPPVRRPAGNPSWLWWRIPEGEAAASFQVWRMQNHVYMWMKEQG